jgi:hypothetical protein
MTNDGWSKAWPVIVTEAEVRKHPELEAYWPKIEAVPPTEPMDKHWPTVALIFKDMSKEEFEKRWPKPPTGKELAEAQAADKWAELLMRPAIDAVNRLIDDAVLTNPLPPANVKKLKVYSNKVPTHDPYTNPNAHIYHQCSCGAILDPGTKSFAQLNNAASAAGWKIRWGHEHYKAYCVECGKDVE